MPPDDSVITRRDCTVYVSGSPYIAISRLNRGLPDLRMTVNGCLYFVSFTPIPCTFMKFDVSFK